MSPRGWVCQPKALARLDGVAPVLIVAEKSVGDGLLMAKKWPAAYRQTCCRRPLRGATLIPPHISSGSMASNPEPHRLRAVWFMVADPTAAEFWASGGVRLARALRANRTVRSNYWQKSQ